MLITLTCYAPNAAELGFLLRKHPASVFEREFSAGKVWAFYPEVADDHLTIACLTEIDPVGLVRGPASAALLEQYVNDRPYVASSLTSVALKTAFATAMSGRSQSHPERVTEKVRWETTLPAVACEAGENLIRRLFTPLGYMVTTTRLPLDAQFPAWGESDLYRVLLEGMQTVQDMFTHLYLLLPVLDNSKHYYVDNDETEKLIAHGGAWLAAHPERELIARRYLRYKRPLIISALARLTELEDEAVSPDEEEAEPETPEAPETAESPAPTQKSKDAAPGLHEQRLNAVMAAIREVGARSLADLGCGEGRLLALALKEPALMHILGVDVSSQALALARRRLRLEQLPAAQRERIQIEQGSLLYRDRRLEGFDVAALVEVIEHLDPPRLSAMERVLFEHARPRRVVITTPNREYNVQWEPVGNERLRHADHRFEWTRAECRAWAERVATTYRYRFSHQELGPAQERLGAPSQLVIFDRLDVAAQEVSA
ncbi:MAG TPA: 3' terminal RNA ribose 2'-O-methyltransferase Hen1 [Ktedonobacterales bacterium]|jgi:3' terminal RNA ribose 2'-O-methyltransferase Hen1